MKDSAAAAYRCWEESPVPRGLAGVITLESHAGNRSTRADIVHGMHGRHMIAHMVGLCVDAVHDVGSRRTDAVLCLYGTI